MDARCPNCNQYKYSKSWDRAQIGMVIVVLSLLSIFLIPASADLHGGRYNFNSLVGLLVVGVSIGVLLFVSEIIFPTKKITYKCSNCGYEGSL